MKCTIKDGFLFLDGAKTKCMYQMTEDMVRWCTANCAAFEYTKNQSVLLHCCRRLIIHALEEDDEIKPKK